MSSSAIAVRGGQLYAGNLSQLRVWNGTAFTTVATVAGNISKMHVHTDGNLYLPTETFNQHLVYRWNGTTAVQIGVANNFMRCLGSYGNDLVLGGTFTAVSGTPANLLARWNGATWQLLGSGLNGVPQLLFPDRATSSMRAFGVFFEASGKPVWNYAEWQNQPRWQNRLHGLAGAAGIPLIPSPDTLPLLLGSGQGTSSFAMSWPTGVPPGVEVFVQAWLLDTSGPQGWSASNALQCTTP